MMSSLMDPQEVPTTTTIATVFGRYMVTVHMLDREPLSESMGTYAAALDALEWMQADVNVTMITITDLIDNTRLQTWVRR